MNENEIKEESPLRLSQVRSKLQALIEIWGEKLPSLLTMTKDSKDMNMTEKMLLNSFRPFLPKLQDSLTSKIDSLTDEELENILNKLESALSWLKEKNE